MEIMMKFVSALGIALVLSTGAYAQNIVENRVIVEQPVVNRVVTGPVAYQRSGMPRPAPAGVIPPVGPAFFPGFIVGPAPWQPLMPMW